MQDSRRKEDLSISYMTAVSALAGIGFNLQHHDDESTDAVLEKRIKLDAEGGRWFNASLRVQLKTTSSKNLYKDHGEVIKYSLKAKNYNDLCRAGTTPIILALLILPEDEKEWLKWTPEDLLINGVMYWGNFQEKKETNNSESVTVELDKHHVINSDTLQDILEKIAKEEEW